MFTRGKLPSATPIQAQLSLFHIYSHDCMRSGGVDGRTDAGRTPDGQMFHYSSRSFALFLCLHLCKIGVTHGEDENSASLDPGVEGTQRTRACDNFYRHVCGDNGDEDDAYETVDYGDGDGDKSEDLVPAPEKELRTMLYQKIQSLLDQSSSVTARAEETMKMNNQQDTSVIELATKLYKACLQGDKDVEEHQIKAALLEMLSNLGIDQWPVETSQKRYREVIEKSGLQPLATLSAAPDNENSKYILALSVPWTRFMPEPKILVEKEAHMEAYQHYKDLMLCILRLFLGKTDLLHSHGDSTDGSCNSKQTNAEISDETLEGRILSSIIQVETKILELISRGQRDTKYEVKTVGLWLTQFSHKIPFTNALKTEFLRANSSIGMSSPLGLHHFLYFSELADYLNTVDTWALQNYYGWFFIREVADVLTLDIRKKLQSFLAKTTKPGVAVYLNTYTCIDKLVGYGGAMKSGVTHLYLKEYFKESSINKVTDLATDLHGQFRIFITQNRWMDTNTRINMEKWISGLRDRMGAPKKLLSEQYIKNRYNLVKRPPADSPMVLYFYAHRQNIVWQILRQVKKLFNRDEMWPGEPLNTRTSYKEEYSLLEIPAGVLQSPLYKTTAPNSKVYGSTGTLTGEVFANALTHAGRVWLKHLAGAYRWDDDIRKKFLQRLECLKKPETRRDGRKKKLSPAQWFEQSGRSDIISQKFADYVGLRTAYKGFQSVTVTCTNCDSDSSADTEKSKFQEFFKSFVERFCKVDTTGDEEPRVNFALSLFDKFSSAFGCSSGDSMKGEDKCEIMDFSDISDGAFKNDRQTP